MKKSIIILNRVCIDESPYHEWLDCNLYDIYLLTDKGCFSKNPHIRCKYTEVYEFENYMCNAHVELTAIEIAKRVDIYSVVAYSEVDIIRAARIREELNIPGQHLDNANVFRDKLKMRELSSIKGMVAPNFISISSMKQLDMFAEKNGYPFVIKPRFGMASIGVQKITCRSELIDFISTALYSDPDIATPFIAESFVKGQVYSVDLIVAANRIVVAEPLLYISNCLNYASSKASTVSMVQLSKDEINYQRLIDFSHQIISKFPHTGYGGFHIEAFIDDFGNVTLCEIACRNGGARIPQLFEQVHGVNPDAISVRLQASLGQDTAWIDKEIRTDHLGA